MISVDEAERLVLSQTVNYGDEKVPVADAINRVLAEPICADRDYPPGDRSTMDGIAVCWDIYKNGQKEFKITSVQHAGDVPAKRGANDECVQIMTGAILPSRFDTVVPIEDVSIEKRRAVIKTSNVSAGQFVVRRGADQIKGSLIIDKGRIISPDVVAVLASVGKTEVRVRQLPRVAVVTTGDELISPSKKVSKYKTRRSNDVVIKTALAKYRIDADVLHVTDNQAEITANLNKCLSDYDVVLISGGVSKGEFDYVQKVLPQVGIKKIFHGVRQKPGKPFWFGRHQNGTVVFAFPGNPVSTFVCFVRYFMPWLEKSLGLDEPIRYYAVLDKSINSNHQLTFFHPVKLRFEKNGQLHAMPVPNNGSGDFFSLVSADAFAQLDEGQLPASKGATVRVWLYK